MTQATPRRNKTKLEKMQQTDFCILKTRSSDDFIVCLALVMLARCYRLDDKTSSSDDGDSNNNNSNNNKDDNNDNDNGNDNFDKDEDINFDNSDNDATLATSPEMTIRLRRCVLI